MAGSSFSTPCRHVILFQVLLILALLATSVRCKRLTVRIKNEMGPEMDLEVHCHSYVARTDLGAHNLPDNAIYSFSFPQRTFPEIDNVVYECTFVALGFPAAYVPVYSGSYYPNTHCSCRRGRCPWWRVTPAGFFCGGKLAAAWPF